MSHQKNPSICGLAMLGKKKPDPSGAGKAHGQHSSDGNGQVSWSSSPQFSDFIWGSKCHFGGMTAAQTTIIYAEDTKITQRSRFHDTRLRLHADQDAAFTVDIDSE